MTQKIFHIKEEWLAERRKHVTATDIAALFGVDPYRSAVDVWMNKTQGREDDFTNLRMESGKALEPLIKATYTKQTGNELVGCYDYQMGIMEDEHISCTPDDLLVNCEGGLECKWNVYTSIYAKGTPDTVRIQCAVGMMVYELEKWDLAVMTPWDDDSIEVYELFREENAETKIKARVKDFWENHVLTGVAPDPVVPGDSVKLWPKSDEKVLESDAPELIELATNVISLGTAEKQIKDKREGIKERLRASMGTAERMVLPGYKITFKTGKRSRPLRVKEIK